MKIHEYNEMMSYLTRPAPKMQQAALVDELEPGPLKDELLKDFDPSQEIYEEYLRRKALERQQSAYGGRMGFDLGGLADKLNSKQIEWYKDYNLQSGGTTIRQSLPGNPAGGPVITIDALMKEKEIMDFLDDKIANKETKINKYMKEIAIDNKFDQQRFERVLKRHYPQTFVYKGMKYKNLPQATIDKIISLSKEDKSIKEIINSLSDELPELSESKTNTLAQKQLQRVRSIQKMLKALGEKPIPVGKSTPLPFEETARRDNIIKDFFEKNPGAKESSDSLAKKLKDLGFKNVSADYIKQSINQRNIVPGIKLIQRDTDIFPEVKALDKIIKENKALITSDEKVTPKINKIVRQLADATGKTFAEANSMFFARMRRLGDLYAGNKPKVKLYEEIKTPIDYDDNFRKHFIQLASRASKGGLNNVQMASLLGLPEKEIRLIGQTATMMKGFGKEFQMQGDHTDIKSMMNNFDNYKNNFSRIEYIKGNLNAYKGIFDKKIKNLSVEADTANPTRQKEILKEQAALRKEFMDKTGYRIGEFGIDKGRVFINPKTLRLPDLMNPMNETLQQAMKNLETTQVPPDYVVQKGSKSGNVGRILHTPKEVWNEFDRALMNAKTVEERLKLFEYANKNPEIAKQSKYLQVLSKAPKVGKIVKGILKGTAVVGGTMGMATLANSAELGQMPQGSPGQLSEDEEGLSLQDKAALGTVAVAGAKPAWKYLLKPAVRSAGAVPLSGYLAGKELSKEDPNYTIAGADLLLPEIGKRVAGSGTGIMSKIGRGVLNPFQYLEKLGKYGKLGRIAAAGARIPSLMTPAGITLQGVELVNQAMKEQKRIDEMRENDPEAYQEYLAEQEEFSRMAEGAAEGGRVGFDKGSKPKSPGRRTFIKGITALAALPLVGRFFKLSDIAKRASTYTGPAIEKIKGMPEWFPGLVKKLWNEGDDVTKQMAVGERQVVKRGTLEGGDDVDLIYQMDTGDVSISVTPKKGKYETESGAYNQEYSLDYQKGIADEMTKGKPADEFGVAEGRPRQVGPDDVELDYDQFIDVDDALSDLTELEAFAKNQSTKKIHKKKGTKPKDTSPTWEPPDYDD